MYQTQERNNLRKIYFDTWQKHQNKLSLDTLEKQVLEVILEHPEYHDLLGKPQEFQEKEFKLDLGESNPFLHMGLHLGIREQVAANQPPGIREVYRTLTQKHEDLHETEHLMIECLAESIWQSQHQGTPPNNDFYVEKLKKL